VQPYPYGYDPVVRFPEEINKDVITRLRRLEGQIRGLQRLVEDGSECRDVVTQLAAAKGALDRIGFKLMAAALSTADADTDTSELERLFLKLS
jgi:DNA-binding FrmR family transcriptional regulator